LKNNYFIFQLWISIILIIIEIQKFLFEMKNSDIKSNMIRGWDQQIKVNRKLLNNNNLNLNKSSLPQSNCQLYQQKINNYFKKKIKLLNFKKI